MIYKYEVKAEMCSNLTNLLILKLHNDIQKLTRLIWTSNNFIRTLGFLIRFDYFSSTYLGT